MPLSGRDDKVRSFVNCLGKTLWLHEKCKKHANKRGLLVTIRLLITRYPQDLQVMTPEVFWSELIDLASPTMNLTAINFDVLLVLVTAPNSTFHRAHARNLLQQKACHDEQCLVTGIDVDMNLLPSFFDHAMDAVESRKTVFFLLYLVNSILCQSGLSRSF